MKKERRTNDTRMAVESTGGKGMAKAKEGLEHVALSAGKESLHSEKIPAYKCLQKLRSNLRYLLD